MTRLVRLQPSGRANETIGIDRNRAALISQNMQNDAIAEGGAFADSGAPHHAAEQNVVENCRRLADACRKAGVPVIHVWYVVEDGAKGLKLNERSAVRGRPGERCPRQGQLGCRAGTGARTSERLDSDELRLDRRRDRQVVPGFPRRRVRGPTT
jgi:hypothetical protein